MASKVAEAYVAVSAQIDTMIAGMQKGRALSKAEVQKMCEDMEKAEVGLNKEMAKLDQENTKSKQTMFSRLAEMGSKAQERLKAEFQKVKGHVQSVLTTLGGLAMGLVALGASTDFFPHGKAIQIQLDMIKNEIYMALIPAFNALRPVLEQLRQLIYKNRALFADVGTALAKGLGLAVKVLGGILNLWKMVPGPVKDVLGKVIAVGVAAALIGAKLVILGPVIGIVVGGVKMLFAAVMSVVGVVAGIGGGFLALLGPIALVVAAVTVVSGAMSGAFTFEQFRPVLDGLQAIWDAAKKLVDPIMDMGAIIANYVSPIWESMLEWIGGFFQSVAGWINDNMETFQHWAQLVGEIVGGVITTISELWQGFWSLIGSIFDAIGIDWAALWDGCKSVITAVLDFLSLVFSNFKLSLQIAWTSIQLAAVIAFDAIVNAFWQVVAVGKGVAFAIAAAFSAAWNNILAAAERVFNRIRATFTAAWEASTALFRGRNPITAFRNSYEREVGRLDRNSRQFQNVGNAAARAYEDGYDSVMRDHPPGRSAVRDSLEAQLRDQVDALNQGRERQRESNARAVAEARATRSRIAKALGNEDTGGAPAGVRTVKFETTGLKDMWKKVQESMTGGSMMALQQRQVKAAEETQRTNREIAENTRRIANAPPAGPPRAA